MSEIYKIIEKTKLDVVNNPIEQSHGLPNECYTSEAYTKIERMKIFEDKWIDIGVKNNVFDSFKYLDTFGQTISLKFKNVSLKKIPNKEFKLNIPEGTDIVSFRNSNK